MCMFDFGVISLSWFGRPLVSKLFFNLSSLFCGHHRYELLIMLPRDNTEFPNFVHQICNTNKLQEILEAPFYSQMAHVMVPRFKLSMTPSLELKDTLKSMGVQKLFADADLKKIAGIPLFVSDVVHQAVLEV